MLENPTDSSVPPTTVKRYAPPNQRNRVHNRRKSGDRFERTSSSHSNDGEKNQTSSRNTLILEHTEAVISNHLNENAPPRLIALNGCCSSEAAQILNDRWAAAIHSYNDPTIDLSERPVMYSGSGASAWGHPSLPHQVLSVKLDEWTEKEVDTLVEMGGNNVANMKYEAMLPDNIKNPKQDSTIEERSDFIRRKYELLQFSISNEHSETYSSIESMSYYNFSSYPSDLSCPFPPVASFSSLQNNSSSNNFSTSRDKRTYEKLPTGHRIHGLGHAFRNSWRRKENEHKATQKVNLTPGMVEFVGLIEVNIIRGTNLDIRDVMTSDPYVILKLGQQSVRTRVIKNNLNPVWNERLMLSIPEFITPLKLVIQRLPSLNKNMSS